MMPQTSAQKKPQLLTLSPDEPRRYRDRPSRVFTSAEIRLRDVLQAMAGEIRDDDGRPLTAAFERWARGATRPLSHFAHDVVAAAKHGGDEAHMVAIADRLAEFVREVFRKYARRAA
jgi:hypothetical protein